MRTKLLTGRCPDGYELDHGKLQHVVYLYMALCGVKPRRLSNGWIDGPDNVITCQRCLKIWRYKFIRKELP